MSPAAQHGAVRVVLADGRVALLRALGPDDHTAVLRLHQRLEQRDQYFRFFGPLPPKAAELVLGMTAPAGARHAAVGVFLDGTPLGVANYEVLADPTVAEIALAVSGTAQAHGVGTLLLEHLVSLARRRGVRRFVAEVLSENGRMLRMFRGSGLSCRMSFAGSVTQVDLVLDETETYLAAMGARERAADGVNLRAVLRPRSLVVVGASANPGSVGHAVLKNLLTSGYTGQLYVVNPHPVEVLGVPTVVTIAALPLACELAVLCVPAVDVPEAARQCGRRGVPAIVVTSAGLTSDRQLLDGLLAAVRRYGMRMVGPSSLGVCNTDPAVRLDATLGPAPAPVGSIGLITQAGGIGFALCEQLGRLGLGLSTMVSTGDKCDVSGNDLLMWWWHDDTTTAVALCLESFGNPRKFSRLCQALARTKPVLAVRTAITETDPPAAGSQLAAVRRDALLRQAGVIVVDNASELVGTLAALSWQPLPPGNRVAVLTNGDGGGGAPGAEVLARAGLALAELNATTTARLRALLAQPGAVANPVRTTAMVDPVSFARCVAAILDDPGVDAIIASTMRTAMGDPLDAVAEITRGDKPVLAVRLGQPDVVAALSHAQGVSRTACYADPSEAAAVLGRLAGYARWRRRPEPVASQPSDVDAPRALAIVREYFRGAPAGGWLGQSETLDLLGCFGLRGVRRQPMAPLGRELLVKVRSDGVFGPLVELGPGGTDSDRITRLTPLGAADVDELLSGLLPGPGCSGAPSGPPGLNLVAAREALLRVGLLAQLLPEVTELDLNPLIVDSDGCHVIDVRVRVAPVVAPDPFLPALSQP
jgi:acyl-CoA synthetase (NDP forming)/GNAT superfamily N-acetyltransferase